MTRNTFRRLITTGFAAVTWLVGGALTGACLADSTRIERLSTVDESGKVADGTATVAVPLNGRLAVVLNSDPATIIDPSKAVLLLNGRAIGGFKDTLYLSNAKALVFHLVRNGDNADDWAPLLAAPTLTPRALAVSVWLQKPAAGAATLPPAIAGADGTQPSFALVLISSWSVLAGLVALLPVLAAVWAAATNTNILKDALLPQLTPKEQPYSLGRTQMALWFTVVFAAFVFLFVVLWDYNTLTSQALTLMGISSATAVFAVAIDAAKDTPIGAANETLRAIGLNSYGDVLQLQQEIAQRQAALQATPAGDAAALLRLQTEITDRQNKLRTWREKTRPFVSIGWFRDMTSDINGPALHRLQVVVWTVALGCLFVLEVYRNLAMPEFSSTLLTLMGVTSAGYLGFKYPERQN